MYNCLSLLVIMSQQAHDKHLIFYVAVCNHEHVFPEINGIFISQFNLHLHKLNAVKFIAQLSEQ